MRHRLCLVGLVGLLIVTVAYAYASPFLTIQRVQSAARRGDTDTVSAHVDYPALRQSLKDTLGAAIMGPIEREVPRSQYAALGMAMVIADRTIEAMVAPNSVSAMVQGRRPQAATPESPPASGADVTTMGYETMDRFVVKVARKNNPTDSFTMVWRRSGLSLTWQLSAVRFSDSARAAAVRLPGGRIVRPMEPSARLHTHVLEASPPLPPAERPRWLAEEEAQAQQEARERREGRDRAPGDWEVVLTELERKRVEDLDPMTMTTESYRDPNVRVDSQQALALAQELNAGNFQRQIVVASSRTRERCLVAASNLAQRAATSKDTRYDLDDGPLLIASEHRMDRGVSEYRMDRGRSYRVVSTLTLRMWKCVRADKHQAAR